MSDGLPEVALTSPSTPVYSEVRYDGISHFLVAKRGPKRCKIMQEEYHSFTMQELQVASSQGVFFEISQ